MRPCFRRLPVLALLAALLLLGGCSGGKTTEVTITERPAPTAAPTASPATKSKTPAPKSKTTEPKSIAPEPTPELTPAPAPKLNTYVINTRSSIFHNPGCKSVKKMKESNKVTVEAAREDLIAQGYSPCGNCHP